MTPYRHTKVLRYRTRNTPIYEVYLVCPRIHRTRHSVGRYRHIKQVPRPTRTTHAGRVQRQWHTAEVVAEVARIGVGVVGVVSGEIHGVVGVGVGEGSEEGEGAPRCHGRVGVLEGEVKLCPGRLQAGEAARSYQQPEEPKEADETICVHDHVLLKTVMGCKGRSRLFMRASYPSFFTAISVPILHDFGCLEKIRYSMGLAYLIFGGFRGS